MKNKKPVARLLFVVSSVAGIVAAAGAANVKITPLGSHDGEFCRADRALIFEDPDGTRILYDAGRTVRGGSDPRLGKIDGVLLSHVHADHLGDVYQPAANAGTCAAPDFSSKSTPSSVTEEVVLAKKARLFVGGEMGDFFSRRLKAAGGGDDLVRLVRFGGQGKVGGVTIASVPAAHSNGLDPKFLSGAQADSLAASGLTAYVGPAGGYVVTFSNGLAVYLSGDTGIIADQDLVVRRYYRPKLAVMNIGGVFSTGPAEAAYVINELVQPNAVIASHANEAATKDGKLLAGSKTLDFKTAVRVPVYLPLSGKAMEFNAEGKCVAGCSQGN
ncbi:MBL fold metallo-hydrolase [Undibacterium sp.]|jgi:L-ascorbate metabolism protein UlaG (beta-lactamase superfamily)|uniref:MBL fold metallo-hydrolase n=1 Tax=Undibacterium sp. TaxID=1914977 RepID=UPI002B64A4C3|nr:MBL fold metallo-hydrolase [Undibacterium sp.]HTD03614.1 MBL fold metallo-hydrolase [Undibacterium sp.]